MEANAVGKAAQLIRDKAGLTQVALARELGISNVYLCYIESGKHRPGLVCKAYQRLFGIDPIMLAWCLYGEIEKLPPRVRKPMEALTAAWKEEFGIK